jgi:hypothetical protein
MEEILSQGSRGTPLAPLDTYIRLDIASAIETMLFVMIFCCLVCHHWGEKFLRKIVFALRALKLLSLLIFIALGASELL